MRTTFKMICSDIDGTLLDEHRWLSEQTLDAFERVLQLHAPKVILTSARMPKAMRYLQKELGVRDAIIAYNGALIMDTLDEDDNSAILFDVTIPQKIAKKVFKKANALDLHISIFSYDDWHVNRVDWGTEREMENTRVQPNTLVGLQSIVNSYVSLKKSIHKIMCIGEADKITELQTEIEEKYSDEIHAYRSKDTYLELSPKAVSKANALRFLQEKYGIEQSEIIAFGDNFNDVDMLEYAGVGVAVANAREVVKAVADFVTLHHKEHGVAVALDKFFNA